jgi:hypothetical protein
MAIAGCAGRSGAWAAIGKTLNAMSAAMEVAAALEGNPCIVTLLRDLKYAIASDQLKFANSLSDDLVTSSKFHG